MGQFLTGALAGLMLGAVATILLLPDPATETLDYNLWIDGRKICSGVTIEHELRGVYC